MGPKEILDGFAQDDAFFRLQAVMAGANQRNFAEVEWENPKLRKQIAAFDRTTTLSAVAALLTYPSLHANTVRLELLQNLVHRNANGPNKPTVHRLSLWLNKELGSTWAAQDSPLCIRKVHFLITSTFKAPFAARSSYETRSRRSRPICSATISFQECPVVNFLAFLFATLNLHLEKKDSAGGRMQHASGMCSPELIRLHP